MSLASWLADGADPAQMTPEEVRRQQNRLAVREEQSIARIETLAIEQADLVERGAATASPALRRALVRRHRRMSRESDQVDRELARIGRELSGLRRLRELLRDGVALAAPGDCAPLLALLDDPTATEPVFADQLAASLRAGQVVGTSTQEFQAGPDLLELWEKMDRGEISSPGDLLRERGDE